MVVIVSIIGLAFPNANQSKIFKSLRFFFRLLRPLITTKPLITKTDIKGSKLTE